MDKLIQAKQILRSCFGNKGIWASDARYRYQCWTRDFIIAVLPLLLETNDRKGLQLAKHHLNELAKRQKSSGQIPILFLDNTLRWLAIKAMNSLESGRLSFMLKQFMSEDGVFNLTPWTKDSELLYLLGVGRYYQHTQDLEFIEAHSKSVDRAWEYIEQNLMYQGLILGSDWRDTRPDHSRRMLLTNNCFLYEAYQLHGMHLQAEATKAAIREHFWTGKHYRDFLGVDEFDTFGNALAILTDIATPEETVEIMTSAKELDTPYGYRLNGVTLPPKDEKERQLMQRINQNGVIWPYIHGFMTMAQHHAGYTDLAKESFAKYQAQVDFFEFYDPESGAGHGSANQLWSACLFLRCWNMLH
jgi:glycogen debranching enzyme